MIEIKAIGGYGEYGRNCTAIKYKNEVLILDLGLHLENYIKLSEDDDRNLTPQELIWANAVPNLENLGSWKDLVKAIVPTHAHLDHVGAIPYLAPEFDCPIISTPFTIAVIKSMIKDKRWEFYNELKVAQLGSTHKISENFEIEFINITHSTPDSSIIAVHTPEGTIIYANDFKIDNFPTLGDVPDINRLKEISKKNIKALIIESLYADLDGKTPSESEARRLLEEVLFKVNEEGKSIIVSTFSSHISRLKSIVEIGKKLGRKILFLGRSLARYVESAQEIGLIDFTDIEIVKYGKEIRRRMETLAYEKDKYLIVCTGHQGERRAVLSRMAFNELKFNFGSDDIVVFSCRVIPSELNEENREILEYELKKNGVEIHKDIHTSGHGSKDDLIEIIDILKPNYVIPAHGSIEKEKELAKASELLGYRIGKDAIVLKNGDSLNL